MRSRSGYKKTGTGGIPEEWEVARLGKVAEVHGGATPSTSNPEYWNGDIAFVTPTDVTGLEGRNILLNTQKRITKKGLKAISAKLLPEGTVLTTTSASIGFCCISGIPAVTNQGFANLVCRDNVGNLFLL